MSGLFIYIPTYKRPELLERQLHAIAASSGKDRIRVLVSNNDPGSEAFAAIVKEFAALTPMFEFRENPGNIGGNANILLGFLFCRPDEYLWILSDDDLLVPGAPDPILSALENEPDLVHVGAYPAPSTGTMSVRDVFRTDRGAGFGLISAVVYRFSFVANHIGRAFDYIESSFPHLAVSMSALRESGGGRLAMVPIAGVFTTGGELGDGDYSISYAGFGYLADLLEPSERRPFLWNWFRTTWLDYFLARDRVSSDLGKARFARSAGYIGAFGLRFRALFFSAELLFRARRLAVKLLAQVGVTRRTVDALKVRR